MKRFMAFLLFSALFLTACAQTGSYSPTVITPSKIELSSAQTAEETLSALSQEILPVESESFITPSADFVAERSQTSSAAASEITSAKSSAAVSSVSSVPSTSSSVSSSISSAAVSSKQSTAANSAVSSEMSSVPAAEGSQEIEVISVTSPIVRGQDAKITIKGKPDVEYTIKVIYKSGPSTAKGLEPKTCELNGLVTWSWKVSSRTTAGDWRIEISGGGASITVPFVVTE